MPRPTDPDLLDDLTGLSNERHFRIIYEFAFAIAERGIPLSIAVFDLHDFESYRGERGEEDAETAIRRFGEILGGTTRQMDVVARVGETRCASLLVDCNVQGAMIFADRVLALCEDLEDEWGILPDAGIAAYDPSMEGRPEALRDGAEAALLEAGTGTGGSVVAHRPE